MKYALLLGCLVLGAPVAQCQTHPSIKSAGAATSGSVSGKVIETMNSGGYTYFRVDTGTQKSWVAATQFAVKVGDTVSVADAMPMRDYHSKTLNRDFDVIYFADGVTLNGKTPGGGAMSMDLPKDHPPISGAAATRPAVELSGIKKADGGKTIAEIFAGRAELKGKSVKVRGRVVKYNAEIMGMNWLHIQDGTGSTGSNDLTVTTSAKTKVGDTVLVTGTIAADRDFGSGYKYGLIIEDAKVSVE